MSTHHTITHETALGRVRVTARPTDGEYDVTLRGTRIGVIIPTDSGRHYRVMIARPDGSLKALPRGFYDAFDIEGFASLSAGADAIAHIIDAGR